MYLGLLILVLASLLFVSAQRAVPGGQPNGQLQQVFDTLFALSVFVLGPQYLAWIIWRRRERLIGPDAPRDAAGAGSGRQAPRAAAQGIPPDVREPQLQTRGEQRASPAIQHPPECPI